MTNTSPHHERKEPGALPWLVAVLSFIPLVGVLFGTLAIAWGLLNRAAGGKKVALVGTTGIALTAVLYSWLFYVGFIQRGGRFEDLRSNQARGFATLLVASIEFYKTQHGHYPETLDVLRKSIPATSPVFMMDPSNTSIGDGPKDLYYELAGANHYYLLGVGPDGLPFTDDDILPEVDIGPASRVGLKVKAVERGL